MPFQRGKIVRVKSTTMEDDKEIERLARKYRGQTTMSSRGPEYIKIIFPSEFYANKFMTEFDEPDEIRWMGENAMMPSATESINENVYIRGSVVFVTDDPENGDMYNDMISKARKFGGRVVYHSKNLYKITFKTPEIANKYAHSIADPEFIERESMNEAKKVGPPVYSVQDNGIKFDFDINLNFVGARDQHHHPYQVPSDRIQYAKKKLQAKKSAGKLKAMESTLPTLSSLIPEAIRSKKKPTKFVSTIPNNTPKKPSRPKKAKKGKFTMPTASQQARYNQKTNLFSPQGRITKESNSLTEDPILGRGMSKAARAADVDQSDREYIAQRQKRQQDAANSTTSPHNFDFGVGFMVDKDDTSPGKFALYAKDPMLGKGRKISGGFTSSRDAYKYLQQNSDRIRKALKSTRSKNI